MIVPVLAILLAGISAASCGGSESAGIQTVSEVQKSYEVNGVTFNMVAVPASTFGMGTRTDGRLTVGADNIHQVIIDSYAISEYPVTQALWKAVMGSNPSAVEGDNYPVDKVDLKACQQFVKKLSKLTGVPFVLPTEAQWEYAVNNGFAKYVRKTKEWTADSYASEPLLNLAINPRIVEKTDQRVIRTDIERGSLADYTKAGNLTFRLAVNMDSKCSDEVIKAIVDQKPEREHSCKNEIINVNGFKIDMVAVKGGEFEMGGTSEQSKYADDDEKPVQKVTVEDFELARYEVTVGLWKAVMGDLPYGNDEKNLNLPVFNISWYRAQEFILELNKLTGRKFRLPTEAEWEYAARGGQQPGRHLFAGSNSLASVGAYAKNSASIVQPVGKYMRNELDIYDMSGNVWEWCQDKYAEYGKEPAEGELHVMRGGSAASPWDACRVANRSKIPASNVKGSFGFRLAL